MGKFHSRTIVNHTPVGKRQTVKLEGDVGFCHTWVDPSGLGITCITNSEYPIRVAYTLLSEELAVFVQKYPDREYERCNADTALPFPEGEKLFGTFQSPSDADKITQIEKELDEIKGTVVESMDGIMRRGE